MLRKVVGKTFSHYRIIERLCAGGMGVIYVAEDTRLARKVAVKFLPETLARNPEALERFEREAHAASALNHPNICTIYDAGEEDGRPFLVMELLDGQNLREYINRKPLPLPELLEFGVQVAGALEAAHAKEIIHRDIKPANIFVTHGYIKILDFGLAKLAREREREVPAVPTDLQTATMNEALLTRPGATLGTFAYMSPEQARGEPLDTRTDLFSFGAVLYEMATGRQAFEGNAAVLFNAILSLEPTRVHDLNPTLPPELVAIISKALAKDRNVRYQHAADLRADLQRLKRDTETAQGAAAPSAATPPRRRTLLYAGTMLVVLAIALATAILSSRNTILHRSNDARPSLGHVAAREKYMAVLPFQPKGDTDSIKYVSQGMQEALSAKLSGFHDLYVASPEAVDAATRSGQYSIEKAAKTLGVTLVLFGAFEATGDKIKVAVELKNVPAGRVIWKQEFSGQRQDLLAIEDQIYTKLLGALDLHTTSAEQARSSARPSVDVGAYDLYLRARNLLRGRRDDTTIAEALNLYEQAIRRDAGFALAYTGIADASLSMYDLRKDSFWTERALGAANQAQRLNDSLPEIHFALGSVYTATGRGAEAIAELKRALELAPNADDGYRRLGNAYRTLGQRDEAIQACQKAVEINPYSANNYVQLGGVYFQFGMNDKAMIAYRKVTELEPDNPIGHNGIGAIYFRQGKWAECIPAFQKAAELRPFWRYHSNIGVAYFYMGNYAEAVRMFEKAVNMNPNDQLLIGNLADGYRWLGNGEKAVAAYDRAIALAYRQYQVNPRDAAILGSLAIYYAKKGDASRSREFIRRARSIDRNDPGLIYKQAVIGALIGEQTEALKNLRMAFSMGYSPAEAKNDPELKSLRVLPEFERIIGEFLHK
jgi:eukaryotic-like serine/threonine-protein kinase